MQKNKMKGQLGNVPNTVMTIALIGVIAIVVSVVMDKVDDSSTNTHVKNISLNTTEFLTNVTVQLPLLGTVIILGVVISTIVMYFWRRR